MRHLIGKKLIPLICGAILNSLWIIFYFPNFAKIHSTQLQRRSDIKSKKREAFDYKNRFPNSTEIDFTTPINMVQFSQSISANTFECAQRFGKILILVVMGKGTESKYTDAHNSLRFESNFFDYILKRLDPSVKKDFERVYRWILQEFVSVATERRHIGHLCYAAYIGREKSQRRRSPNLIAQAGSEPKLAGCYAKARGYELITIDPIQDDRTKDVCSKYTQLVFAKHCAAALILRETEYLLVLDADTGVVNPNHCIEDYIDPQARLILYKRFFSGEIMAGNYLAKNSDFAEKFLMDWADLEFVLPKVGFHNADNGALHQHFLQTVFPNDSTLIEKCQLAWNRSHNRDRYDQYVACTTSRAKGKVRFGDILIAPRDHGFARDGFPTEKKFWRRDFMFHDMKAAKKPHFADEIYPQRCSK